MLFSWFNTRAVDAFIDAEVASLVQRVPPAALAAGGKKADTLLAKAHDELLRRTQAFVRKEKPNLYKKARIANRFKWALREAGYVPAFADEFAYEVAAVAAAALSEREI